MKLISKNNVEIADISYCLNIHEEVIKSWKYNFEGYKIPVNTRINISFIISWLWDYEDTNLCEFMVYAFPTAVKNVNTILSDVNKTTLI